MKCTPRAWILLAGMCAVLTWSVLVAPTQAAARPEHDVLGDTSRTWYGARVWGDGAAVYVACVRGVCRLITPEEYEDALRRLGRGDRTIGVTFTESSGLRGQGNAYALQADGPLYARAFSWGPPER